MSFNDKKGLLDPPGLRMAGALEEVRQSIERNLAAKKRGRGDATEPPGQIETGLDMVRTRQEEIRGQVETIGKIAATLDPGGGSSAGRQSDFDAIFEAFKGDDDPVHERMAGVMQSFRAGLFVGGDATDVVSDNLDLEPWFRLPKGHERRIHGHRHAGVRLVQEGPTLVHA